MASYQPINKVYFFKFSLFTNNLFSNISRTNNMYNFNGILLPVIGYMLGALFGIETECDIIKTFISLCNFEFLLYMLMQLNLKMICR